MPEKTPSRMMQKIYARSGYLAGAGGINLMVGFVTLLGYGATHVFAKALGRLLFRVLKRMRAKVIHNLGFAYGDNLSMAEKNELARKIMQHFCRNWAELFFAAGPSKKQIWQRIGIQGRENLERALAQGQGVIAVSAHYGNYGMIVTKLAQEGYNAVMAVRDLKTEAGSAIYLKSRRMIVMPSIATVPGRRFYSGALKTLKNDGVLCLIADENKRYGGIFVDFFGRTASTAPGPAALAVRTGARVVPIFIRRNPDNTQTIIIDEEIDWRPSGDTDRDMRQITARFTRAVENCIRQDPTQWIWTNWRWRTQPWGQSRDAKLTKNKKKLSKCHN